MTNKEIKISFREYDSLEQMDASDMELAKAAVEAMELSYAPYSDFNVGAAVRLDDGEIVKGANQENAAYPSGLCAERTAMFYAGASRPDKAMHGLVRTAGPGIEHCSPLSAEPRRVCCIFLICTFDNLTVVKSYCSPDIEVGIWRV